MKFTSKRNTGETRKKNTFLGKVFKSKKKKAKKQSVEEGEEEKKELLGVQIIVEQTAEELREDAPAGRANEDIQLDPSCAGEADPASGKDTASERDQPQLPEEEKEDHLVQEVKHANPNQGWMGGLLDNMSAICGPPDQQLPTIMSGEEMEMVDMDYSDDGSAVMSPTGTIATEPEAPALAEGEEEEEEQQQQQQQLIRIDDTVQIEENNEDKETKMNSAEIVSAENEETLESPAATDAVAPVAVAPMDAPTTPKSPARSLASSPVAKKTNLEPEEEAKTPAETEPTEEEKALIVVGKNDDMVLEPIDREPVGTKIDIFAGMFACCKPTAVPSMDEIENQVAENETKKVNDSEEEEDPKDPDGDKEEDCKSVTQHLHSVVADENKKDPEADPLPKTEGKPVEEEPEEKKRFVGMIHKEKKNTKMGLSLKNSTIYQGVFIAKIKASSLFSETDLRVGMQVLEINGKPCPVVLEEAVTKLRHTVGDLEIVAQKPKCEI